MKIFNKINSLGELPRFNVEKKPLFNEAGIKIPGLWSLVRDDKDDIKGHIGVCSDIYRPIQINEMIDVVSTASDLSDSNIEHIGFTENTAGSQLVIQSKIGNIGITNDDIDGYLYTIIDHRGKSSNRIFPSTIRIACMNAFHLVRLENKDGNTPSLRHSLTFDEKVQEFLRGIQYNVDYINNFSKIVDSLRVVKISEDHVSRLAETLFPKDTKRSLQKRESIVNSFKHSPGCEGKTAWDALNAVTYFETHQKTSSNKFIRNITTGSLSTQAYRYLSELTSLEKIAA